jgi:hypothetical protein
MSDILWYTFLVVSTILPLYGMARVRARVQSAAGRIKMPKMGAIARDE